MYRQFDQEMDETVDREALNQSGMYGEMPYEGMQQYGTQGMQYQGMPAQIGGRPMICYPMMYDNRIDEDETADDTDMYRQYGMGRPRPYYNRPRRRRRRRRPYYNIYPYFYPYPYPYYPYYYDEDYDEYDY